MAQDKDQKTLNVPPLRFPGFTDEWRDSCLLSDCDINPKSSNLEDKFVYLDLESVEKGELRKYKIIERLDAPSRAQRVLSNNDVLFQCVRPYQQNNYLYRADNSRLQWVASTGYAQLRVKNSSPEFIYHLLSTQSFTKKVIVRCTGSNYPAINSEDLSTIHYQTCSLPEQKKIANFLTLLDERIATQNKIIEDLKKLKSAIIDKVFCLPSEKQPNKRLDGFNGDWEIVKLSEICERMTDRNSGLKCNLVLTIAAQYGLVSQLDFFNKSVASENLSSYYVLKKGDFAYNKSYSGEYIWGAIKKLDYYEEGVLSPLYICFRPNKNMINSDFLAFYFETKKWHRGISEIAGEGARNHGLLNISVIDFFNTIHRIPSLTEQIRIATVLQTYQNKINNEERLLLQYQTQRKFLLSTMFI